MGWVDPQIGLDLGWSAWIEIFSFRCVGSGRRRQKYYIFAMISYTADCTFSTLLWQLLSVVFLAEAYAFMSINQYSCNERHVETQANIMYIDGIG